MSQANYPPQPTPADPFAHELSSVGNWLRADLEAKHQLRERALSYSRTLIRQCAESIRATHRAEYAEARQRLAEAQHTAQTLQETAQGHADLFASGYTQDALKEWVEANLVFTLLQNLPTPTPTDLVVETATYLNGLAEAATELRRRILDILRHGHSTEAERLLGVMDEIYSLLVTMDFPDALTNGLRRQTDIVRGVLERTRGDLTTSLRQEQLEKALQEFNRKIE
ncbi:MAG TPA: haloacid dehalogenase [Anaerolineales bacterium]|nr:haloacid dehalogenase [Anaerolineales bacterium]